MKKKKKRGLSWLLSALLGFVCALALGALFYGTMVYQLAGEPGAEQAAAAGNGLLLALPAALIEEQAQDVESGGEICRVTMRTYALADGGGALAVSAAPAAYFETLSAQGFLPRLVTGFTLAGLDAVCFERGETLLLAARSGDYAYMLRADTDEQTLYALGAGAELK